jgi:glutamine---fructose-6-phosphate transaminase (isomerizing)
VEVTENERSETYTRSYTGALAVLALIAGELGAEGLGPEVVVAAADGLVDELARAAEAEGVPVARLGESGPEPADELMAQIPLTVRLQLLALRRAEAGGHDPDEVIVGAWAADALWNAGAP